MFVRAVTCTVFIFALMIGGFFLLPHESASKEAPFTNVALSLIDVLGNGGAIQAGAVSLPCLATRDDTIADQFEMLKEKITGAPGSTQYVNGIYVSLAVTERRPVFQIRYPAPEYCAPFLDAYKACFAATPKDVSPEGLVSAISSCIEQGAAGLDVKDKDKWSGLIEELAPTPHE